MSTTTVSETQSAPVAESSATKMWGLGIAVACLAGWAALNFIPVRVSMPEDLAYVHMYSPPEIIERHAIVAPQVKWQNCLLMFSFGGLTIGLVTAFFMSATSSRKLPLIVIGAVSGIVFGFLTGQAGWTLRGMADSASWEATLTDPLYRDTLVFFLASLVLTGAVIPVYLAANNWKFGQPVVAILLAGALAGLLCPIVASLFPGMATHIFPPENIGISAIWLTLFALLVATVPSMTGSRKKPAAEPVISGA